jgi:AcrR family transcriptional regulator
MSTRSTSAARPAKTEARKDSVLRACTEVIAEQGLERTTLRTIARRAGCTTGVLMHHFRDKDEILLVAVQQIFERLDARMDAAARGLGAWEGLRRALADALPLDRERVLGWKVWLAFVASALGNAEHRAEHARRYGRIRDRLRRAVESAAREGSIDRPADARATADAIFAAFDGIGTHAILEPARFPRARQLELLETALDRLANGKS